MKHANDENGTDEQSSPWVVSVGSDFQGVVLDKLARLEAKMDMLSGNGQPGRMKLAEDRIAELERNDLRRNVYDRLITAAITFAISALIAWHDHLPFLK